MYRTLVQHIRIRAPLLHVVSARFWPSGERGSEERGWGNVEKEIVVVQAGIRFARSRPLVCPWRWQSAG